MADDTAAVISIVKSIWRPHAAIVGDRVVADLAAQVIDGREPELRSFGGSEAFDWQTSLEILQGSLSIVLALLQLNEMRKKGKDERSATDYLAQEIVKRHSDILLSNPSIKRRLPDAIARVIDDDSDGES